MLINNTNTSQPFVFYFNFQGTPSAEAGYPQYSNYDTRVDTFMNSKWGESEDKYTFAAAGFYYYGTISDLNISISHSLNTKVYFLKQIM